MFCAPKKMFCAGHSCGPKGMPRKGLENSAQGFNPGTTTSERRALKGRQIESTSNATWRSNGPMDAKFISHPVAPSGRVVYFEGSQG